MQYVIVTACSRQNTYSPVLDSHLLMPVLLSVHVLSYVCLMKLVALLLGKLGLGEREREMDLYV